MDYKNKLERLICDLNSNNNLRIIQFVIYPEHCLQT